MTALRALPSPTLTTNEVHATEARLCGYALLGAPPEALLSELSPTDFDHTGHRALWQILKQRHGEGLPLDGCSVLEALIASDPADVLGRLGGPDGFTALESSSSLRLFSADVCRSYVGTIKRAALGRRLQEASAALVAVSGTGDLHDQAQAREMVKGLVEAMDRLEAGKGEGPELEEAAAVWQKALEAIGRDMADRDRTGIAFGLEHLDAELAPGMRPGRLFVIGAGSGEGKSTLALQAALEATKSGRGVLYLSWEMDGGELLERAAAAETGIPAWRIQRRTFTPEQISLLERWRPPRGLLAPLVSGMDSSRIPPLVDKARRQFEAMGLPLGLVVVDHLQLVHCGEHVETRALEVKAIANVCKQLALSAQIAVLALSQLSRQREQSRPAPWNLKESGGIEEAADCVLLLVRERDNKHRLQEAARVIVGKHRGGRAGQELPLVFDPYRLMFADGGPEERN